LQAEDKLAMMVCVLHIQIYVAVHIIITVFRGLLMNTTKQYQVVEKDKSWYSF